VPCEEIDGPGRRSGEETQKRDRGGYRNNAASAREQTPLQKDGSEHRHAIKDGDVFDGRHAAARACTAAGGVAQAEQGERNAGFRARTRVQGLGMRIDEAGRGPLAGPVVAAAVVLDSRRFPKTLRDGLDDSKVLSIEQRETCYRALRSCADRGAARIGIGAASAHEIDRVNILRASLLAMARAVDVLGIRPRCGARRRQASPRPSPPQCRPSSKAIRLSFSNRCRFRHRQGNPRPHHARLGAALPGYGWETNVGYATREHGEAIRRLGITRHHRLSVCTGPTSRRRGAAASRSTRSGATIATSGKPRDRVPRNLLHQCRQRVITEPFDRAPESFGGADTRHDRELELKMGV